MERYLDAVNHGRMFIRYHFIFSTKYRKRCLVGMEDELRSVFRWVSGRCALTVLRLGIDGDHVHLLVKCDASLSPLQIVRRLKQLSTREMWRRHSAHLSRFYWKKGKNLWASGYFCSTVGQVSEDRIIEYIENQGGNKQMLRTAIHPRS